ncbi:MAG: hypothetical protein V2I33_26035, partial [Kangiellaceae bacterium]|nr:hypothetical protein [Kangiellaceae bacterium]
MFVPDDTEIAPDQLVLPAATRPYIGGILVSKGLIKDRVQKLASDIRADFGNVTITILVLLKGAFRFARDLTKALEGLDSPDLLKPYEIEFIKV